jgi:hypothetical protein
VVNGRLICGGAGRKCEPPLPGLPQVRRIAPLPHLVQAPRIGNRTHGDSHDCQSSMRRRSHGRGRNRLLRAARNRGLLRRELEHARRDHQRPLRQGQDRPWHKQGPHSCDEWKIRCSPDPVGRAHFRLRARQDECRGRSAQSRRDRTVQSGSRQREMVRYRSFRRLHRGLDRRPRSARFLTHGPAPRLRRRSWSAHER